MHQIVYGGDTLACVKKKELITLNTQLSLLTQYTRVCDSTVHKANEIIDKLKLNEADYTDIISNQNEIIRNNEDQMQNLKDINKNKRKIWLRRFIYGSAGGLAVGVIAGILIAK